MSSVPPPAPRPPHRHPGLLPPSPLDYRMLSNAGGGGTSRPAMYGAPNWRHTIPAVPSSTAAASTVSPTFSATTNGAHSWRRHQGPSVRRRDCTAYVNTAPAVEAAGPWRWHPPLPLLLPMFASHRTMHAHGFVTASAAAKSASISAAASQPSAAVQPHDPGEDLQRLQRLLARLADDGVEVPYGHTPGAWQGGLQCPFCGGGDAGERSFSVVLGEGFHSASYRCWRANKCGREATVFADDWSSGQQQQQEHTRGVGGREGRGRTRRQLVLGGGGGGPLLLGEDEAGCVEREELDEATLAYFAARGISASTLRRAGVFMARHVPCPLAPGAPPLPRVVAYPYHDTQGQLVNITYHDVHGEYGRLAQSQRPTAHVPSSSFSPSSSHEEEQETANPTPTSLPSIHTHNSTPTPTSPPPSAPPPSLRWQHPGGQRVLWGLSEVSFVGALQRQRQREVAARRPPLGRRKREGEAVGVEGVGVGGKEAGEAADEDVKGKDGEGAASSAAAAVQQESEEDQVEEEDLDGEEGEEVAEEEGEEESDEGEEGKEQRSGFGVSPFSGSSGGGRGGSEGGTRREHMRMAPPQPPRGAQVESEVGSVGAGVGFHDLVVVEDELERLSMMEAGIPNVLALPPRAVLEHHLLIRTQKSTTALAGSTAAGSTESDSGLPPSRRRRARAAADNVHDPYGSGVLSYMHNSREVIVPDPGVVGGRVRVTLALKDNPESAALAEALARSLPSMEGCRVLRWPGVGEGGLPYSGGPAGEGGSTSPPAAAAAVATYGEGMPYTQENSGLGSAAAWTTSDGLQDCDGVEVEEEEVWEDGPEYLREDFAAQLAAMMAPGAGAGATRGTFGFGSHVNGQQSTTALSSVTDPLERQPHQPTSATAAAESMSQRQRRVVHPRTCGNDVLVHDGSAALRCLLEAARPFPVKGLLDLGSLLDQLVVQWSGLQPEGSAGVSTGWRGLDELYMVVPGELTIVTGVPNSGKSHWLDALAVQLASGAGWRIAFASFEKSVVRHAQNLIELAAQQPMFGPYGTPRMSPQDFEEALAWVHQHFVLIRHADMADEPAGVSGMGGWGGGGRGAGGGGGRTGQEVGAAGINGSGGGEGGEDEDVAAQRLADARRPCTIDWVLEKATVAGHKYGIRGLVIDPYNELEQPRGAVHETEYVSAMLSKIKRWAQRYQVHVWLVAHPKSLDKWDGSPPTMYDISGSAHWNNKADMGIVVHRYTRVALDAAVQQRALQKKSFRKLDIGWSENETLIKVLKARNKTSGAQGDYILVYDKDQCKFVGRDSL